MKETPQHQKAFEVYYGQGPQRTLAALAAQVGASVASVKLWSRTFGWAARIAERDAALASAVEEKVTRVGLDRRTRNRKILEATIVRGSRAALDSGATPTFGDLVRLMTAEAELAEGPDPGEALERELRGMTPDELRAVARAELRELAEMLGETAVVELLDRPKTD